MAVSRKGWRKIVVSEHCYFWKTFGRDVMDDSDDPEGIDVAIVTEQTFERGQTAQQLLFALGYDHKMSAHVDGNGFTTTQRARIAPGIIAEAIRAGLKLDPPFTGESGASDIVLPTKTCRRLQELAHHESDDTDG